MSRGVGRGRIARALHCCAILIKKWHTYTVICVGGGEFWDDWGVGKAKWYCGFMVEATKRFRLHPTSISYVYKVF
jgi:hypothetical protein